MTDSPQTVRKPLWQRINKLFLVVVVLPTLVSSLYFGLIASDVYISQSKFVIYNPLSTSTAYIGMDGSDNMIFIESGSKYLKFVESSDTRYNLR